MKELTESWAELGEKIRAGDFEDIHTGDYKPFTLATGEVVNMKVDSIHPWWESGNAGGPNAGGPHVTFVPGSAVVNFSEPESITREMEKIMEERSRRTGLYLGALAAKLAFSV